ncbi:hypothetical protein AB6A40_003207 [Gnathostoma spinigerum]|uniref:proline--tRNA ligase n=1 Tax=Gnathostoma spinigerum TaxID=75299 RepID=A0ABD6EHQ7_9BILA
MPLLSSKTLWMKSGRWDKLDSDMFRLVDRTGKAFCLQPTAEEMITQVVAQKGGLRRSVFPLMLYQTTTKYRDEMNPRFGLLRSREFLMNDLYSFDISEEDAVQTYGVISEIYDKVLRQNLELNVYKVRADCGMIGGEVSHEYHVRNESGEDIIKYCHRCRQGINAELSRKRAKVCDTCLPDSGQVEEISSIEIGHTFQLGNVYSSALGAVFHGCPLIMNCFGLGVGRIIAATVDLFSPDHRSMRLPETITPFRVAVIIPKEDPSLVRFADSLVQQLSLLSNLKGDILVDDRVDLSFGKRLNLLADLGVPHILVIGNLTRRSLVGQPLVEYFRTELCKSATIQMGHLTHSELFDVMSRL